LAGAGGKSTSFLSSMSNNIASQGSGNNNSTSSNNPDALKSKFLEVCEDKTLLSRIWEEMAHALRKDMPQRATSLESISGGDVTSSPLIEEEV
jgi:hypothetical protein